jgi:hypothetical protein
MRKGKSVVRFRSVSGGIAAVIVPFLFAPFGSVPVFDASDMDSSGWQVHSKWHEYRTTHENDIFYPGNLARWDLPLSQPPDNFCEGRMLCPFHHQRRHHRLDLTLSCLCPFTQPVPNWKPDAPCVLCDPLLAPARASAERHFRDAYPG